MSELHSLVYTSSSLHESSLAWDYHSLGVLNTDKMSLAVMDGIAPSFSALDSDFSTGYLEDALVEFAQCYKRRRLLPCNMDATNSESCIDLEKSFWHFNPIWPHPAENFYCMNQIESIGGFSGVVGDHISTSMSRIREEQNILAETRTPEETTLSTSETSNSSSCKDSLVASKTTEEVLLSSTEPTAISAGKYDDEKRNEKRVITRVVYPFAVVKPGGREGEVTLNDVNERILMAPTRPVRHPVGDFACRPCVSAQGPGLSGKAVVALTRIHTQGRGTITIIRTKS